MLKSVGEKKSKHHCAVFNKLARSCQLFQLRKMIHFVFLCELWVEILKICCNYWSTAGRKGGLCGIFAVLIHACSCFTRKRTSAPSNLLEVTIEDRRQVEPSIRFGRKECRCSVTCLFPVPDSAMQSQFFGLSVWFGGCCAHEWRIH